MWDNVVSFRQSLDPATDLRDDGQTLVTAHGWKSDVSTHAVTTLHHVQICWVNGRRQHLDFHHVGANRWQLVLFFETEGTGTVSMVLPEDTIDSSSQTYQSTDCGGPVLW